MKRLLIFFSLLLCLGLSASAEGPVRMRKQTTGKERVSKARRHLSTIQDVRERAGDGNEVVRGTTAADVILPPPV